MDSVWIAYIRDRRKDLYRLNKKRYPQYSESQDSEMIIGVFDTIEKAERAINIVLQRMGWRSCSYHPNIWMPPDIYEYGWKKIPFNQFNTVDLYSLYDR